VKFGPLAPEEALGAVSVHAVRAGAVSIKKGATIDADDVAALKHAGIAQLVVARLEPGDVSEDEAAELIAARLASDDVRAERARTGRANLFAAHDGVLRVSRAAVDAINRIDPAITLATLADFKPVVAGEMIATVKIIPFALAGEICERAVAGLPAGALQIAPYRIGRVALISTRLAGLAESVIDKTVQITRGRLAPALARVVADLRIAHDERELTGAFSAARDAGAELIIVFGASAIADRRDVIPAAIEAAGGHVEHFGMPVDPGNLMLIGALGEVPVLGAPGCARSPRENGFDWILSRVLASLAVTREDLTGLGVGGLLMEIVSRTAPRVAPAGVPGQVAAVVLAAGLSRRMGAANKMLALYEGKPMVRRAVEAALASKADPVLVVLGHEAEAVRAALADLPVRFVDNADYREGLASSLRAGIAAVPQTCDGALICLGDMPRVDANLIDALIAPFAPARGALIVVPVREGRRGNPVVWSRRYFAELMALSGDEGARRLIRTHDDAVIEVPVADDAAFFDIDTRQGLGGAD